MRFSLWLLYFLLLFFGNIIIFCQEKIQAEKINFTLSNSLLHPALRAKDKSLKEVPIIIPTTEITKKSWVFRAWETSQPFAECNELLNIGISYQINSFILPGSEFFKADKTLRNNFVNTCKEFKVRLLLSTAVFTLPLKRSDLENVNSYAQVEGTDIYIKIQNDLILNQQQTKEYLQTILSQIKQRDKVIYLEAFGRDDNFLSALESLNDPRIIPSISVTKKNASMTEPLNTLVSKVETSQIARIDLSEQHFGENELFFLKQDYLGYRITQCMETNKNILGFIVDLGNTPTPFGTMNAVNLYTMNELLLDRNKDIDLINHNWFTAMYGLKDGTKLLELTAPSFVIIRQALYACNQEITFTNNLIPITPSVLLTENTLETWCKLKKAKNYRNTDLFKEKLRANEMILILEKNYKSFIEGKKIPDAQITLLQISRTKEMVTLIQDYTSLFLQAQFDLINQEAIKPFKSHIKAFPALEPVMEDFRNIFILQKPEILDSLPQENLPVYLRKADASKK